MLLNRPTVLSSTFIGVSANTSLPSSLDAVKTLTLSQPATAGDLILLLAVAVGVSYPTATGFISAGQYAGGEGYRHEIFYKTVFESSVTTIEYFGTDALAVVIRGASFSGAGTFADGFGSISVPLPKTTASGYVVFVLDRDLQPLFSQLLISARNTGSSAYFSAGAFYALSDLGIPAVTVTKTPSGSNYRMVGVACSITQLSSPLIQVPVSWNPDPGVQNASIAYGPYPAVQRSSVSRIVKKKIFTGVQDSSLDDEWINGNVYSYVSRGSQNVSLTNLLDNKELSATSTLGLSIKQVPEGVGINSANGFGGRWQVPVELGATGTIVTVIRNMSNTGLIQMIASSDSGSGITNQRFQLRVMSAGTLQIYRFNTAGSTFIAETAAIPGIFSDKLCVFIARCTDTSIRVNATDVPTVSSAITGSVSNLSNGIIYLNSFPGDVFSYQPTGIRLFSGAWSYAFSDSQVQEVIKDFRCLFAPRTVIQPPFPGPRRRLI